MRRHRACGALLRGRERGARSRQGRPGSDIETINTELALADLATVEKPYSRYGKVAKTGGDKEAQRIVAVLDKVRPVLDQARPARSVPLSKEEQAVLKPFFLLTAKPAMYVANVSEHGFQNNPLLRERSRNTRSAKARRSCRSAPRSRRRSLICRTRTSRSFSPTWE